ncbi:DUF5655 domain-containing protein [Algoriphagus sediminis]|uniref:DUF5655 domain-containing protein n=1 Tax=Algoriphagus sediminis TaxID=3057113 RepID=A0ABT7YB97_9BACT|nr:DUF5655 domain-containing protein [Algoriphagus sediminis]MDN3203783.1 DUF5655 domain-containing protein [Algoriphagus sediminis]
MDLYNLKSGKLEEVKNLPFKLEKDIQSLVEGNLEILFGLEFVTSEFQLNGLRIDSLGFDKQSKSFVIIEYKKRKNDSVIDQGYSYLALLINNKADFILEYQERTGLNLKRNEIDWSQSRVIFISPQFTTYQRKSIDFKDLPFELWEIKKYSNNTIALSQHKSVSQESVKSISSKDNRAKEVSKEIVVYTEEDHFAKASDTLKELYEELKEKVSGIGDFDINPLKHWINFKASKKWIFDVEVQKARLKMRINLNKGQLDDPKGLFRDVSHVGHFGYGDYEAPITSETDLDYLMSLIKQSYNYHNSQ